MWGTVKEILYIQYVKNLFPGRECSFCALFILLSLWRWSRRALSMLDLHAVRYRSWISSCVSLKKKKTIVDVMSRCKSVYSSNSLCGGWQKKDTTTVRIRFVIFELYLLECFCWKLEDVAFFINPQILYWLMRWFRRHLSFTGSEKCIAFSSFWCYVCFFLIR